MSPIPISVAAVATFAALTLLGTAAPAAARTLRPTDLAPGAFPAFPAKSKWKGSPVKVKTKGKAKVRKPGKVRKHYSKKPVKGKRYRKPVEGKRYKPVAAKHYTFHKDPRRVIKFVAAHPAPGGGWCRLHRPHRHAYTPVVTPHWAPGPRGYVYLAVVPGRSGTVVVEPPRPPSVVWSPPTVVRPKKKIKRKWKHGKCKYEEEWDDGEYEYEVECDDDDDDDDDDDHDDHDNDHDDDD